jgi:hypothetical protein
MTETPNSLATHLANRLREEGEKTLAFFRCFGADEWRTTIYTNGALWTLREVLAHNAEAEASMRKLIQHILGGGSGTPEDFDLNRYNQSHVARLEAATPGELLDQFAANRNANIEMVASLRQEDLDRPGRHPFLGMTTVAEIVKMLYRHNQIHAREIRRVIQEEIARKQNDARGNEA